MTIKTADQTPTLSLNSLPLARSANQALNEFKDLAGETEELAKLSGATLLYERALMLGLAPQPQLSPNGSCRLLHCENEVIAMNLPRPCDWELLPALLCPLMADDIAPIEIAEGDWDTLDAYCQPLIASDLLEQAHCLGIAASMASDLPPAPMQMVQRQCFRQPPAEQPPLPPTEQQPLVIDLSGLWAGPLCSYLLQQAGCRVIKVESKQRLDGARLGSPVFYQLLNQGKESVVLDFDSSDDIAQLKQLIAQADIVIEASRPRALRHLGIDAEQLVKTTPSLVWLSITGHGRSGPDGERIGFGDDAAAAAGLSQIAFEASGEYHLIGDAIADPLTGIHAALAGLKSYRAGGNELISLSLRDTVAACLHRELAHSQEDVLAACQNWINKFPLLSSQKSQVIRTPTHACAAPGEHNEIVLKQLQKPKTKKQNLFIKNAEVYQVGINDLRIENGIIKEMGNLTPQPNETIIDAKGGALLPGLNDHHIHFLSYAAALASVDCSPIKVIDRKGLINALQQNAETDEWLRGFGYHESIAGDIDCHWLDQYGPDRLVRIQHRTGRLWIFNSAGLDVLRQAMESQDQATDCGHELLKAGFENGRFYDVDQQLKALLGRQLPPIKLASEKLATYGITGFSDMTPSNDQESFALFDQLKRDGLILQKVQLARRTPFSTADYSGVAAGPVKIHLHENRLPPLQDLVDRIVHSHKADVAVAIHCVTDVEILFSLAALEEAGTVPGDRIEHASITPEYALERIKALGVRVVTQPHFIAEKGDTYLKDIPVEEHASLYRCAGFIEHGISLAGSSDAPFGSADPWAAMKAAVERRTVSGQLIGSKEQLSPEQALGLFIGSLENPGQAQQIRPGMEANLCLLKYPWVRCRHRLRSADVKVVICEGANIFATEAVAEHVKNKNEHQTPCPDLAASA